METVINIIKDIFGSAAFIGLALLVLVFFIGFYISKGLNIVKGINSKLNNLPCEKQGERLEKQESSYHNLDKTVAGMQASLEYISRVVTEYEDVRKDSGSFFTQTHSPLSLSESGKKMILQLGLDKALDEHWNNIKKIIDEDVTDKTTYDIQQYCMEQTVVFPEKFRS